MKKFLCIIISLSMVLSISVNAFAAESPDIGWKIEEPTTAPGIEGIIFYQENSSDSNVSTKNSKTEIVYTVSYTENSDGSYTVYQYENDTLIEEHTTTPNSGVVYHEIYNADGTVTESTEIIKEVTEEITLRAASNTCPYSKLASNSAVSSLGYMHYRNLLTNTIYSISCELVSEQHLGQSYTFGQGTAKSLADWTSALIAWFPFVINPVSIVSQVLVILQQTGVLSKGASSLITVLVTKTMVCDYYKQEIHGTSTSHSGYPHVVLEGTYAAIKVNGVTEIQTEGYTVRDWGKSAFGRWMMYKVFGIDEAPTSWTNT